MNSDMANKSQLFINNIDLETRESILKLDQKLKGLHAEIESKLHSYTLSDEDNNEAIQKLSSVAKEIDKAINGINTLVNLVANAEDSNQAPFRDKEGVAAFRKDLAINLEKITKIQEQI